MTPPDNKALAERLRKMADECEASEGLPGTFLKQCSGFVHDDLTEAARLIALREPSIPSALVSGGGECNCASGRGSEHCVVHAPRETLAALSTPQARPEASAPVGVEWVVPEGQFPANVEVDASGRAVLVSYGKGHPSGRYALTQQPAATLQDQPDEDIGCLREQAIAWEAVAKTLNEVAPDWTLLSRRGMESACIAIRKMARPDGGEAVATLLSSDPYDDSGSEGPWMHMHDWDRLRELPAGTKLYIHPTPAPDAVARLEFTDATIDKMQSVMATHGFTVPVRVISDAFHTTIIAQREATNGQE